MICCRWLRAKRVKSGMLRDTVAQNPTVPLSAGIKNFKKSAKLPKREVADTIGPNPPAVL